ncbi:MAG: ATP-binding protein [Saprospiraceae bacterium]|nr:ATP-binding protein [Saprospiraceae bacterium]
MQSSRSKLRWGNTDLLMCKIQSSKQDQIHISSIINNLLDNAEKISPEHPEIVITTRDVKGGIKLM